MNVSSEKYWGVITGDFIGFSDLDVSIRRRMPQLVADAGNALCDALGPVMPWDVDIYRGDEWQALISDPVLVLRAALFFRAYIIMSVDGDVDMRMAIGIGPIDYVPAGNVAAGDGPAYRVSGKLLEAMTQPRHGRIRCAFAHTPQSTFAIPDAHLPDEDLVDTLVRLVAALGGDWRNRQARAVVGAIRGWTQEQIARSWPGHISRQGVGRHLRKAGWDDALHALGVFERKVAVFAKQGKRSEINPLPSG